MDFSKLYDLIQYLERGTKMHIGVLFFGNYGNEKLILPFPHQIHVGKVCDYFKNTPEGFKRCYSCRCHAIRRALTTRTPFGGFCVNGVYEYIHPVIHGDDVAALIYIGNIAITERGKARLITNLGDCPELIDSLELSLTSADCRAIAALVESYIRLIFEACGYKRGNADFDPRIENVKKIR
jgi:ligand-binding sensor protein